FTQKDTVKDQASLEKFEESFGEAAESVLVCAIRVRDARALIALADFLTPALTLGWHFARAWDEAKAREGFIDFDDQIRQAAMLLERSGFAEWIRYKLDRRFDHVLVDEAQDTNAAQWRIIDAITDDFFSGQGAKGDRARTLFVVGDYKQAIFRFQGTSPENFEAARKRVKARMADAAANAEALRANLPARRLRELGLGRSYRTAQHVLDFVNRAIAQLGHETFGLSDPADEHIGDPLRPGHVAFWRPVGVQAGEEADDEAEEGGEGWLSRPDRQLADRIARQVQAWLVQGFVLHKGRKRRAGPGDVMILVRKRRELASLIVARLHAAGVPVAGVDRLRLGAPLAVRDLLAALRFAAQPLDDLTLASLLVSPLVGWSQEQLLEHGYRPKGERLWHALRRSRHADVTAAVARLVGLLNRADVDSPQALLHWLLTGEWDARRKLVARLGAEANDPIDELLNAAQAHASAHTPSLTGFLHWFDAGEGELKREAGRAEGLVQVMTVHGSKGLQRPIVILADAAGVAIRPYFRTALDTQRKGDATPVTVADRAAEEAMRRLLKAEAPRDGVIGEEFGT
ncbi:MAG TPA: UvrD-helicase domain-containing protein, partial [Novosphingobium sp.]|nr:UvrD-helicase domain-containing protein [Novosphingobium sp.]